LAFGCEVVDFSGAFVVHVPLAVDEAFLFKRGEQRVDGAWAEVDAEGFAYFGDDLVAVHGLRV